MQTEFKKSHLNDDYILHQKTNAERMNSVARPAFQSMAILSLLGHENIQEGACLITGPVTDCLTAKTEVTRI